MSNEMIKPWTPNKEKAINLTVAAGILVFLMIGWFTTSMAETARLHYAERDKLSPAAIEKRRMDNILNK